MAKLTIQEILKTGLDPAFATAAAGGDNYVNDDRTFLVVKNGGASPITVTIAAQRTSFDVDGFGEVTFSDMVVNVPNAEERWIKAPRAPYNDVNGLAQITYDAVASVTVAAVKMPGG